MSQVQLKLVHSLQTSLLSSASTEWAVQVRPLLVAPIVFLVMNIRGTRIMLRCQLSLRIWALMCGCRIIQALNIRRLTMFTRSRMKSSGKLTGRPLHSMISLHSQERFRDVQVLRKWQCLVTLKAQLRCLLAWGS